MLGMKSTLKILIWAVVISGALTLLAGLGALKYPDLAASDALYQSRSSQDGVIALVEIDQKALEELGPYNTWKRDIIAMTIEALNKSEDCRPAVIALDILYAGETEPEFDAWLAEAAGRYGNVITAGAAKFGNGYTQVGEHDYNLNTFTVTEFESPYHALLEQSTQAHINVMLDKDGIFRNHLLYVKLPDGSRVPSLALAAAEKYRLYHKEAEVKQPLVNSRGFWYLPFTGKPGDFSESISVADVLSGEVPAEHFAGKIVLIGPYAPGFQEQDGYFTAIDHGQRMYGVEIHANAIQALLRGEYKKEAGNGVQLAVLFVLLVLCFFGFWKRKVPAASAVWALAAGGWILIVKLLYAQGYVWHVLWVPVGVTVLFVGCIAYNYISAALEKQRVTGTFKRYVDPSVMHELLREGTDALELGGKDAEIAVLFVDIRGFTTMSENLPARQVVEILNEYLTLTTQCVMENHGTLDKFVGDCTMAIWNAPLPQEDYVMNACRAAMAMVERAKPLEEKLRKEYGRTVSFGVGVNAGPAVVGNIGAPMRMDYTAIGDTVNTAARLEANAPAGTVYISRAVADALEGRIRTTSLGDSIRLKGKQDGFEVLKLEEIL